MKHPEGNRVFIGFDGGYLYEYSINEKVIVHDFGKISDCSVSSMTTTFDNKYLFVLSMAGGLTEIDTSTRNQVKNFKLKGSIQCVVTYDNKFLITATEGSNTKLTKWSIQTKQLLHTWDSNVNEGVASQNCSQDSKYQFIGYARGWLGIFDIQKDITIKNIQALSVYIYSVAFTQDNQSAFISDFIERLK